MPKKQAPRSVIPQINTVADLAAILRFDEARLRFYVHSKKIYKSFPLRKRSGGTRIINAPEGIIKEIQKRLNTVLQTSYGRRAPVHAYVHGRSCVTNAEQHLDAQSLFNIDLEDFFGSIHMGRVQGLLMAKPYSFPRPVARMIARICCHNGSLPQGAPTSPVLSNMIAASMDADLKSLARSMRCIYTRYADDITFSTQFGRFPDAIVSQDANGAVVCGDLLQQIFDKHKFKINNKKTRLALSGSRKEVTGVIVGEKFTNVRRSFVRTTRCMLHALEKYGLEDAEKQFIAKFDKWKRQEVSYQDVLRGRIEYIGQVRGRDSALYLGLITRFLKRFPAVYLSPVSIDAGTEDSIVHRAVFVLRAVDADGMEYLSSAFFLNGVGLVSACHAVRNASTGELYGELGVFRTHPAQDGRAVRLVRYSTHYDLSVLEFIDKPRVNVGFQQSGDAGKTKNVKILGYPRFNYGAQITSIPANVIRTEAYQGIHRIITDGIINEGNSGGPVMNLRNQVVAIAVEGRNFTDNRSVYIRHLSDAIEIPPAPPQPQLVDLN